MTQARLNELLKYVPAEIDGLEKLTPEEIAQEIENSKEYYDWLGTPEGQAELEMVKERFNQGLDKSAKS